MRYSAGFILSWPFLYLGALLMKRVAPFWRATRNGQSFPWVIGGHRGRLYADNSAALHAYMVQHVSVPPIWISANPAITRQLRAQGCTVLVKNSWAARWAILRAPVLVYSHGEDDLDTFLKLLRGHLGLKVYLNHCFNLLKSGQMERPGLDSLPARQRRHYMYHIVRFDVLLASSTLEKANFEKSFAGLSANILPYGGAAHMDFMVAAARTPPGKTLVWFPTWRDTEAEARGLDQMMASVVQHPDLSAYLHQEGLQLAIVGHINSQGASLPTQASPHIVFYPPSKIVDLLAEAACFISDYSGLIFDWLYFNRPIIHFTFDAATYLQSRKLYTSLESLQYGPSAQTADELVQIMVSGAWRYTEPYQANRDRWMQMVFPETAPGFSKRCYETIQALRQNFQESTRSFTNEVSA